jgi:hypothetical protein
VPDRNYTPSPAAREASDYFNSLPREQRKKLAPLLDNYRQMGLAEAAAAHRNTSTKIRQRIRGIQNDR